MRTLRATVLFFVALGVAAIPLNAGHAQGPASNQLDAFFCYKAKTTPQTPKFLSAPIPLIDQFEDSVSEVSQPEQICNPATIDNELPLDVLTHLEGYQLKPLKGVCVDDAPENSSGVCKNETACGGIRGETEFCASIPKHIKQRHVRVENPVFGDHLVDTIKPDRLLVPTAKCIDDPQGTCPEPLLGPDPANHDVDHYKCYTVKVSPRTPKFPKDFQVRVSDQFEDPTLFDVVKPTRLCNPVDKAGEGIKDIDTHLMCYQVRRVNKVCADAANANTGEECKREPDCGGVQRETRFCVQQPKHEKVLNIHVSNQFGEERLDTIKEEELCIPSSKFPNEPSEAKFTATPDAGPAPHDVAFDGSASTDPEGPIKKYSWDFGDKKKGKGATSTHKYRKPGTYTAKLMVEDAGGLIDSPSARSRDVF